MTHGRKPRRPRPISRDPLRLARNAATRLTKQEVASTIDPLRQAARHMREGVGDEMEWTLLASAVNVAKAIERQGVVRGLGEHLQAAEHALNAISRRALDAGTWVPTAMYWQEIEHINALVDLHEFQMQQLSYGEMRQAAIGATDKVRSVGGQVIEVELVQGALL